MARFNVILLFVFGLVVPFQEALSQLQNPRHIPCNWQTDTTNRTVPLSEFTVAVPKGAFPVLNNPAFIGARQGQLAYFRHELVISVEINGKAKAYPLNVLTVHEISKDTL